MPNPSWGVVNGNTFPKREVLKGILRFYHDLPFGNNATILEPIELIQLMKHNVHELYQHYV